jgi:nitrite reductase/ring-hydroxylating ferredoxin subunit
MQKLCQVAELGEPDAKGFSISEAGRRLDILVVRADGQIYGYIDACPHIGTPLEFLPDRFLTRDRTQILCSTHGARFEIATGYCVAGPCKGRSLQPFAIRVNDGWLTFNTDAE